MGHFFANPYTIVAIATGLLALGKLLYHRVYAAGARAEKDKRKDDFISAIASNHLPHLFAADRQLMRAMNKLLVGQGLDEMELDEPPKITFGNGE